MAWLFFSIIHLHKPTLNRIINQYVLWILRGYILFCIVREKNTNIHDLEGNNGFPTSEKCKPMVNLEIKSQFLFNYSFCISQYIYTSIETFQISTSYQILCQIDLLKCSRGGHLENSRHVGFFRWLPAFFKRVYLGHCSCQFSYLYHKVKDCCDFLV